MRNRMSDLQRGVFEHIANCIDQTRRAPTYGELARAFGRPSGGAFSHVIDKLAKRGLIRHVRGRQRGIELVRMPSDGQPAEIPAHARRLPKPNAAAPVVATA